MQIESKFILSARLTVEGPLRMKEEYVEGILESPTVIEETVPEQLRSAFGQAVNTMQQLPVPIRDAFASGVTIPLSKLFFIFSFEWNWTNKTLNSILLPLHWVYLPREIDFICFYITDITVLGN